jgi:hypothetical protein
VQIGSIFGVEGEATPIVAASIVLSENGKCYNNDRSLIQISTGIIEERQQRIAETNESTWS